MCSLCFSAGQFGLSNVPSSVNGSPWTRKLNFFQVKDVVQFSFREVILTHFVATKTIQLLIVGLQELETT